MVGPSCAPLAQMRPWFAGAFSTPRTRVTCPAVPSSRSRQPTPQYGQIVSPSAAMRDAFSPNAAHRGRGTACGCSDENALPNPREESWLESAEGEVSAAVEEGKPCTKEDRAMAAREAFETA